MAGSLTLLRLFLFLHIRFLPYFFQLQNAVNIRLGGQQLLHILAGFPVLGVCRFFLCHQRGVFGLQTLDSGEFLDALVIEKLLCRLMECDLTFMLRKKLLGVTGLAIGNIGIAGLGIVDDIASR